MTQLQSNAVLSNEVPVEDASVTAQQLSATAKQAQDTPAQVNTVPKWVPGFAHGAWTGIANGMKRARTASIMATPAPVVNYSSNVLGAMHMATEMLMFKSGMKGNKLIDNPENPVNWVKQPVEKIWKDIVGSAQSRDFSIVDLFRGNPIKNFRHYVVDTHGATLREVERQIVAGEKTLKLGNPWQTRTTGTGLAIWTLSTLIPERKESDEEIGRMATMRTLHPLQYVGERFKQAVWVPEWPKHKRELTGLGYLGIGIFSMLGSWRNRRELIPTVAKDAELIAKGLKQGYAFNPGYFFTAVISFVAGLPLLFALDDQKAYSTYGSLSVLRLPGLYKSIQNKMTLKEEGWGYYFFGKVAFQVEDFLFSMIGGATKKVNPDGTVTIVDHTALEKSAISEARQEKQKLRTEKRGYSAQNDNASAISETQVNLPSTALAKVETREAAMPQRVAEHHEMQSEMSQVVSA